MNQKLHNFEYDEFQVKSIDAIDSDYNLLVTAHTGCGKTAIAEHAIWRALSAGKNVVFTSPIKALSNEKFFDWKRKLSLFGIEVEELGLLTGDIKVNPEGRLVIMTAEILNNMTAEEHEKIGLVVMDEVHWINDRDRGRVWENTLMSLPTHVQVVLLSATIAKPEAFASWIEKTRNRKTVTIATDYRVVPLRHHVIADGELQLIHANGTFNADNYKKMTESKYSAVHQLNDSIELLVQEDKAPVIFFCMSRKSCESFARQVRITANDHNDRRSIETQCFNLLKRYKDVRELEAYRDLMALFNKGVAYHHSGMIPILKELVEILYKQGLIKVLFATETLAVGVNMPTRTVVFTQLSKWTNQGRRSLSTAEFTQMAGRAGRRGHDKVGYVIYLPLTNGHGFLSASEYKSLLTGSVEPVRSQLQIDMPFVLSHLETPNAMRQSMSYSQNEVCLEQLKVALQAAEAEELLPIPAELNAYLELEALANPKDSFIRIKPNKRKKMLRKLAKLRETIPDFEAKKAQAQGRINNMEKIKGIRQELAQGNSRYISDWNDCVQRLCKHGFAENAEDPKPTQMGKLALCFPDAMPLVMGYVVNMPEFSQLSFAEVCTYLGLFVNPCCKPEAQSWESVMECSEALTKVFKTVVRCAPEKIFNWEMVAYVKEWCDQDTKSFAALAQTMEPCRQGDFIKAVLRMCNFIDQVKSACLIKEDYLMTNRLDDHQERLMSGVVSNDSLYVC
jgi:superfamily II RNA helicase